MYVDPLSTDELNTYRRTATQLESPVATFPFDVVPYTGLTLPEFLHLRDEWIHWGEGDVFDEDRVPIIDIPPSAECRNLSWDPHPPAYTARPGSCRPCRRNGTTSEWEVRGDSNIRTIPVHQPEAQQALSRWFRLLGRDGVPYQVDSLNYIINQVEEKSSLDRELSYQDLRYTFVHICAEQGIDKETIVDIIPNYKIAGPVYHILRNSTTDYDLSVRLPERLKVLKSLEPVGVKELSNEFNTTKNNERMMLSKLEEEGIVEVVQEGGPNQPTMWRVAPGTDIEDGLSCPKPDCSATFVNFQGRSYHLNTVHD